MLETWSTDLMERVTAAVPPGTEVRTLVADKPNWIVNIGPDGVLVHTERSKDAGEAQLVDGWMLQVAWDHLQEYGALTNRYMLSSGGLNVKRSSAVCAILAQLPEVSAVSTDPITLVLRDS